MSPAELGGGEWDSFSIPAFIWEEEERMGKEEQAGVCPLRPDPSGELSQLIPRMTCFGWGGSTDLTDEETGPQRC